MNKPTFNILEAPFVTADVFCVAPYSGTTPGGWVFGQIRKTDPHGQRNPWTNGPLEHYASCAVRIKTPQILESAHFRYWGGFYIQFFHRHDSEWGVAFRANNIIASRYLRMTEAEMKKMLSSGGVKFEFD